MTDRLWGMFRSGLRPALHMPQTRCYTTWWDATPHQAMDNQMPMAVWRKGIEKTEAEEAVDMTLRLDNGRALTTYPQQEQKQQKKAA